MFQHVLWHVLQNSDQGASKEVPKKCIKLQYIFLSSYLVSSMLLPPGSSLQWSVPMVSSYQGKRKSSEFSFARLKVVSLHSDMQENTSSSSMLAWILDNIGVFHEFQIQSFSTFVAFVTNVSLMIQHHPSADCCLKPRFAPLGSGQHQMEKHLPRWIEYGQKYYMIFIDIFTCIYINVLYTFLYNLVHVLISNTQIFKHYSLLIVLTVLTKKTPSWSWSLTGRKQGHVVSEVKEYHSPSAWAFWILLIHQQRTSQVLRVSTEQIAQAQTKHQPKHHHIFWLLRWMFYKDPKTAWSKLGCSMEHVRVHYVSTDFTCTSSHSSHDIAPNMLQGWTKVVP